MISLLITSIGSLSAIGMLTCLSGHRDSLRVIGTNSIADAAGNFLADRTVLVPETRDADVWSAALAAIVEQEKPDLILNGRDAEVPLLADLQARWTRTLYYGPPPALAATPADKHECAGFCKEQGLPFVETAATPAEIAALQARHGFPLIAKPRRGGHASKGCSLIRNATDLQAAAATDVVIQPCLPSAPLDASVARWNETAGVPWSFGMESVDHEIDLLIDGTHRTTLLSAGTAAGAMNRDLRLVDSPGMARTARHYADIFARHGFCGPLNLQGRLMPGDNFVPFELNARFTGTMCGKAALGHDLVTEALCRWTDLECHGPAPAAPTRAQRLPIGFLTYDPAHAETLARCGDWRRD